MVGATNDRPTAKPARRPRVPRGLAGQILTAEEAHALFEEHAQRYVQMSGAEYIAAWERGDYNFDPDFSPEVCHLWFMMPFGLAR